MDLPTILTMPNPFFGNVHHSQIQHFQQAAIGWEYSLGLRDFSKLTVKSFDCICRIVQTPNRFRVLTAS